MRAHMIGDPGKIRSREVQLLKNTDSRIWIPHDIDWSLPEVLSFYEVWALAFYRE